MPPDTVLLESWPGESQTSDCALTQTHTKVTPNKEMPDSIIISPGGIKLPQALMENLQSEVFAPHSIQRSFSLCPPHIPRKSQEPQKPHCNTRGTARTHRIHSLAGGIKNGTN